MVRDTVDKKKCIVIYGLKEETASKIQEGKRKEGSRGRCKKYTEKRGGLGK